jgi:hypothetical protein
MPRQQQQEQQQQHAGAAGWVVAAQGLGVNKQGPGSGLFLDLERASCAPCIIRGLVHAHAGPVTSGFKLTQMY